MATRSVSKVLRDFNDLSFVFGKTEGQSKYPLKKPIRKPKTCNVTWLHHGEPIELGHCDSIRFVFNIDDWLPVSTYGQLDNLSVGPYLRWRAVNAKRFSCTIESQFDKGKAFYERNKNFLIRKFSGEYIAIWNNEVLDHDNNFSSLAQRIYKKLGYVSIYIPFVTSKRRILRFESPVCKQVKAHVF